jgi:hypothetical protein
MSDSQKASHLLVYHETEFVLTALRLLRPKVWPGGGTCQTCVLVGAIIFLLPKATKKVSNLTGGWLAAFLALAWRDAKTIRAQKRKCL